MLENLENARISQRKLEILEMLENLENVRYS